MTEDELKQRVIYNVDIREDKVPPEKYHKDTDPALFHSEKLNRGPLQPNWMTQTSPLMTAYKKVRFELPYWGFQTRFENAIETYV